MTDTRDIERRRNAQPTRADEARYRVPPVDIVETEDSLVLLADMPGVGEKGVEVSVEEDTLSIIGRIDPATPRNEVYYEYEALPFKRLFTLSQEIRRDGIEGKINGGVLRLTLPKAESVRVRKVPIKVQ